MIFLKNDHNDDSFTGKRINDLTYNNNDKHNQYEQD